MMKWKSIVVAFLGLLLGAGSALALEQEVELLVNGNFEADTDGDGIPDAWPAGSSNVQWVNEEDSRFLRLVSSEPGQRIRVYRQVDVAPEHKAFELRYRVRYDIEPGPRAWYAGRVMLALIDGIGERLDNPSTPNHRGSTKGKWRNVSRKFQVPDGAQVLEIVPSLFQAERGTLDVDDLSLTPIDPAAAPRKVNMISPVVAAPPADKLPKMLHVDGNQLKDSDGAAIWLQGLSTDSMQWSATGERIVPTIEVAIDQWNANCIRLAVKEDFWFGKSDQQNDGGARYRQVIDSAINTAAARGAYLVIDLHRFRAPDETHLAFWKEVAAVYKNHPAVMFEVFNEAHGISWEVWRNGGEVTDKVKPKEGVVVENSEELRRFSAIGMQQLVDAIRETGARNIVIVGGLDWSYDLSGILEGYALDEHAGNGIMYSTHVYPWKSDWESKFLKAAEKYPLFVGEVGCPDKWEDFAFIPPESRKETLGPEATWSQDMIGTIQKHRLNWTAFSFHPRCGPMVIKDWEYTPTSYWGVFVKEALAGKQFEVERLR